MKASNSLLSRVLKTIALPVLLYVFMMIARPDVFVNGNTVKLMIIQAIPNVLIAWSMLPGMKVEFYDFSVGARFLFASLVGVGLYPMFGITGYVIGTIAASVAVALMTGGIYAAFKIPSIITGFAVMLIMEAVAALYKETISISIKDDMKAFGTEPLIFVFLVAVGIATFIIMNKTKFGYQISAIGGNESVARSMGINSTRLKMMTFIVGGVLLGIAALVKTGYAASLTIELGMGSMSLCFTPMMGVMIGLYMKSCNDVIGTFIGALSITIVGTAIVALGVDTNLTNMVIGAFLLVFIGFEMTSKRKMLKKAGKSLLSGTM